MDASGFVRFRSSVVAARVGSSPVVEQTEEVRLLLVQLVTCLLNQPAAVGERFAVYDVPEGKSPEDDGAWRPSVMQRTTMDSWTYYDVDCKEDLEHQSHDGDEGVLAEFGLYIRAPTPEEAPPLPSP